MNKERQQSNLEKIMALALDYCPDYVAEMEVDPDWFQQYCDLVLNISNQTMQQLWAKDTGWRNWPTWQLFAKNLIFITTYELQRGLSLTKAASLTCRVRLQDSGHIYFGYVRKPSIWQRTDRA